MKTSLIIKVNLSTRLMIFSLLGMDLTSSVIPSSPITLTPFSSPLSLAYIVDKSLLSLESHLDAVSSSSYCPVFLLSFSCRRYSSIYLFFHHFLHSLFNLLQAGLFPWEQFSFTTSLILIFSDFPSRYHQDLLFSCLSLKFWRCSDFLSIVYTLSERNHFVSRF